MTVDEVMQYRRAFPFKPFVLVLVEDELLEAIDVLMIVSLRPTNEVW
jgi:hypothetical protein